MYGNISGRINRSTVNGQIWNVKMTHASSHFIAAIQYFNTWSKHLRLTKKSLQCHISLDLPPLELYKRWDGILTMWFGNKHHSDFKAQLIETIIIVLSNGIQICVSFFPVQRWFRERGKPLNTKETKDRMETLPSGFSNPPRFFFFQLFDSLCHIINNN